MAQIRRVVKLLKSLSPDTEEVRERLQVQARTLRRQCLWKKRVRGTMHRALWIDEIIRHICSFLPRKALLHFALTCKAFKDPALDELWSIPMRLVEALCPFFKYKVLKINKKSRFQDKDYKTWFLKVMMRGLSIVQPVREDHLMSYKVYGNRVRKLDWPSYLKISPYTALEDMTTVHLFPHLVELCVALYDGFNPETIEKRLLPSSLRQLRVYTTSYPEGTLLLKTASKSCPSIRLFQFWCSDAEADEEVTELVGAIESFIPSQANMVHLRLVLSMKALEVMMNRHLQSTSLRKLQIGFHGLAIVDTYDHPLSGSPMDFPNLEELTLSELPHDFDATSILPPRSVPLLKRLYLTSGNDGGEGLRYWLNMCSKYPALTKLSVKCLRRGLLDRFQVKTISMAHLLPLFRGSFKDLVNLTIGGSLHFDITNEDLALIGDTMPDLTSLKFGWQFVENHHLLRYPEPKIDLLGMISFVSKVPSLTLLRLSVKVSPVDITQEPVQGLGLEIWEIMASTISEPEKCGTILAKYIPSLRIFDIPLYGRWFNPIFKDFSPTINLADSTLRSRFFAFHTMSSELKRHYKIDSSTKKVMVAGVALGSHYGFRPILSGPNHHS
ncbi:hypothetical protein FRC03_002358 [Tulasnella sp. 419]|nr:hypothetical protein FRC03_002358 [Tulasnella sp. 419]